MVSHHNQASQLSSADAYSISQYIAYTLYSRYALYRRAFQSDRNIVTLSKQVMYINITMSSQVYIQEPFPPPRLSSCLDEAAWAAKLQAVDDAKKQVMITDQFSFIVSRNWILWRRHVPNKSVSSEKRLRD